MVLLTWLMFLASALVACGALPTFTSTFLPVWMGAGSSAPGGVPLAGPSTLSGSAPPAGSPLASGLESPGDIAALATASGSSGVVSSAGMLGMRRRIFHQWDADGDDRLSLAEYEAGVLGWLKPPPRPSELPGIESQVRARFAKLDVDGDGYLSEAEFRLPIRGGRIVRGSSPPRDDVTWTDFRST